MELESMTVKVLSNEISILEVMCSIILAVSSGSLG